MTREEQIILYLRVIDDTLCKHLCVSESAKKSMQETKKNLERELTELKKLG